MAQLAEDRNSRRKARSAQSSREQLIDTAAMLFARNGYTKTNMRELAEAVGMKAGSIFYHFDRKDDILHAVMEQAIRYLLNRISEDLSQAETPKERLRVLVRAELDLFMGEKSGHGFVMIHEWRSLSAERQADLMAMRAQYEPYWNATLSSCYEEGVIKADPKVVRRMLNGAFSWVPNWYEPSGEYGFEQLVDEVMAMLVCEHDH